jgi:hypothetical protein
MKNQKHSIFLIIFLLLPLMVHAVEQIDNVDLFLKLTDLQKAVPPEIFDNILILSYSSEKPVRFVGAAFQHENYGEIHPFARTQKGVYILSYKVPENTGKLVYRIVVDGLWMADPSNSSWCRDYAGIKLSCIEVPPAKAFIELSPVVKNKTVEFVLETSPGKMIFVAGSFNSWDPFMYRMKEVNPGVYTFSINLLPGNHFYYYFSEGIRFLDPLNKNRAVDFEGTEVSAFSITG